MESFVFSFLKGYNKDEPETLKNFQHFRFHAIAMIARDMQ